jgi:hypothetical protein
MAVANIVLRSGVGPGSIPSYIVVHGIGNFGAVGPATAYTFAGPSTGTINVASSDFTVQAAGSLASPVVVTPADSSGAGSFTPSSVTLAAGTNPSATFTYTGTTLGARTLSVTNNGGLTDPSSLGFTVNQAAATAYTLTGPSSGFVNNASAPFTVQSNGYLSGSVTITPADSSLSGSFSPATVTLAAGNSTSASFTYTPTTTGARSISTTDSSTLTDPSPITYTASNPPPPVSGRRRAGFGFGLRTTAA